jgi:hypothetical protein
MRIRFLFNTDTEDMLLTMGMLGRSVRIQATVRDARPRLVLYIYGRKILTRSLEVKPKGSGLNGMDLVRCARPYDINIQTSYGFKDPFKTGIVCGAIDMAAHLVLDLADPVAKIETLNQNPDFQAENDYVHLDATAIVDTFPAVMRLLRARRH